MLGAAGNGTLVVDATGSVHGARASVTADTNPASHLWGYGGHTADVTFRNWATGSFGDIALATDNTAGTSANIIVESQAQLTTGSMHLTTSGGTTSSATLTVDGAVSTLTQTGASTLTVGHATDGTANINVTNDGLFISGTGSTNVHATGVINVDDGVFAAQGDVIVDGGLIGVSGFDGHFQTGGNVSVDGGMIQLDGGEFHTLAGTTTINTGGVILVNGGQYHANGTTTINLGGVMQVNGGPYHANGQVDINGGSLELPNGLLIANADVNMDGGTINTGSLGGLLLAGGVTLAATNDAQIGFAGTYGVDGGTTIDLTTGADMTVSQSLHIGDFGGNGTLIVDGLGTTVTAITPTSSHAWGWAGSTADVTFRNGATGSFGHIRLANELTPGTTGNFNVESAAAVTTGDLILATLDGTTSSATLTVDGAGSSLTQTGASTLTMGHATKGTATLNVTGDGTFNSGTGAISVNTTGTINVGTGATGGTFNANGPMTVDGTVNLLDGALNAGTITLNGGGSFNFTGGVLSVDSFVGNLDNQGGTLAPGGSPGITNVTGDYTNQSAATVQIEIDSPGGLPGTDFDRVSITAAANLGGALFADVGYVPAHQDSVQVMTFASRSGVFSAVTDSGLAGNLVMAPFYTATDLTLSVELLGDASGDGSVGPEDYTLWADAFGIAEPSYDDGDLSRNGVVGPEDYTIWADEFGTTVMAPESGSEAVPEPSTLVLLLIAAAGITTSRWRSRL